MQNSDKFEAASALLRQLPYVCEKIMELSEKLSNINSELSGTVRSPRIVNSEEAKYQKGTATYTDSVIELLYQEELASKELSHFLWEYHRLEKGLRDISQEDIELLSLRYEHSFSLQTIAGILGVSAKSVWQRLNNCIEIIATHI